MTYKDKKNQVDLLQEKINSYGELSEDVKKKINYKFRLDWNYYSNSMEGNTLTKEETRSVMVGNLTVGGKPIKDVQEMIGHDRLISDILKIGKGDVRISEARIQDIHKGIMNEEDETKKSKIGVWKTEPNYLYNYKGERFDFVSPNEVKERMHELLNKTNASIDAIKINKKGVPHPLDVALQFHLDYVIIHPFYDGNGRTARILTNLILISFGYPPFWIKTDERNIYQQYIGDIQGYGGNSELFFEFCAGLIMRSQQLILDAIEGKDIYESDDLDKEITLLEQKIHGAGKRIEVAKSKEAILEIYDNSVSRTVSEFIKACEKFDRFYIKTKFSFLVHKQIDSNDKINAIDQCRYVISDNSEGITISYEFISFNREGFGEFNHTSQIYFTFGISGYQIANKVYYYGTESPLQKEYREQMTDEEVSILVKHETKKHKDFIEEQLKKVQDKKKK